MTTTTNQEYSGPITSDAELFAALDLSLPQLASVREAVEKNEYTAAKTALDQYLRERSLVTWWFDPHDIDRNIEFNKTSADNAVRGCVNPIAIEHTFPDGEIDWFYNATKARDDLPDNNEWHWGLNRMAFWIDLARAYSATGDERYAEAWVKQLRSWIRSAPCPDHLNNNPGSAWRPIECGIRMGGGILISGAWTEAYHRFLLSPSFTADDKVLYLKSCLEHARYLRRYPHGAGNHLALEMAGLYAVATVFPEFKDAAAWRRQVTDTLHGQIKIQFLPDGAHFEGTPSYHQVTVYSILFVPKLAMKTGRMAELPPDFIARMEKIFDYNLYLMTPDRDWPRFNDSKSHNVPSTLQSVAELFPHREDFAWVASDGKTGTPPESTSHAFPYVGYYVMRSGWETDANYLAFDAGPLGHGHIHQDKLNLVVWAYGREVLFDSGGGSYDKSQWRAYAVDCFSHNTVLIDWKPQRRRTPYAWKTHLVDGKPVRRWCRDRERNVSRVPLDVEWQSQSTFDYAAGVYDEGYGEEEDRVATHTRRVLFVKPDLFIVADTLVPNDDQPELCRATYQARWHLLTTQTEQDAGTGTVVTTDAQMPNLAVVPLLTEGLEVQAVSAQTEPELLGWDVRAHSVLPYVPATTVTHTKAGIDTQEFLTLLVPIRSGETYPIETARVLLVKAGNRTIEVLYKDGRRVIVQVARDPKVAMNLKLP